MPRMSDVRSVAANTTVENVLSGKLHEFLQQRASIRLMGAASAVGARVSMLIGNEVLVQDQEISAANRFPQLPEDFIAEGLGFRGDRVVLAVRNTTIAAITTQVAVDVTPV